MQAEAPFQLGVKAVVGQRDDARGLVRLFGPDDRRAAAHERQNRERPGGEGMLLGAAVMIALVRDRRDYGGLPVAPAIAGDARALADRRMRAVGGDQQARS